VIHQAKQLHPELRSVVLPKNQGLGLALREGLQHCNYDLVARMDSDDIAKPERFAKELAYLEAHPETSVVGSWVDEFQDNTAKPLSIRKVPEHHEALVRFSHYRNPMNHPTVMFRKADVEAAGSYQHCELFEDYDLWAKMIQQGYKLYNLQESLLWFRLTSQPFSQRGGLSYIGREMNFQKRLWHMGHISLGRMILNMLIRTLVRLIPRKWRKYSYLFFLRK
jgi:glycosyltransferase involved in cell wall biosynthesis